MREMKLGASTLSPRSDLVVRNILVDGYDLDEARSAVSRIFVDHRLIASAGRPPRPVRVSYKHFDALSLCYFDYGRKIGIHPDQLQDFYLLLVPLSGHVTLRSGSRVVETGMGSAAVLPAERDFSMQWSVDARQIIVRVDRRRLVRCVESYLGRNVTRSPDIELALAWGSEGMAPLRHALASLVSLGHRPLDLRGYRVIARAAEDLFFHSLLMLQRSDMSAAIASGRLSGACSRIVRRAESYIEANLTEPLSILDLVNASGGSARALFDSFKRFRNMPPMRYVRHRRLQRAREELKAGNEATNIAGIAFGLGFQHLGRFAADYAREFGEKPSETLRFAQSRTG